MRRTASSLAAGFLGLVLAAWGCSGDDGGGGSGTDTGCVPGTELCGAPGDCSDDPAVHEGVATYYNEADGTGNCSFDASPGDLMIGAMNETEYAASAACGACVRLTGPNAEITIRIVDRCPECQPGHIDLSPDAFSKIADLSAGKVPITWQYAACGVDGPIRYHFKEGSNPWWTAVQIRNHRYPIAKFEFKTTDGAWKDVPRVDYNYFLDEAGMGPGPYSFRVTDAYGQVLEDSGIPFAEAADSPGASQFPSCAE